VDSKWYNNEQIKNIDYFFDVSCNNHFNDIDCLDFVITGRGLGRSPDDAVVLGKNVNTKVESVDRNIFSSVDISQKDYFEIFDVKNCSISQMDSFDFYDKFCVKSNNFTINEQCIKECRPQWGEESNVFKIC
jgi:hypothetical protein